MKNQPSELTQDKLDRLYRRLVEDANRNWKGRKPGDAPPVMSNECRRQLGISDEDYEAAWGGIGEESSCKVVRT